MEKEKLMRVLYLMGGLHRGGTEMLLLHLLKNRQVVDLAATLLHRKGGALLEQYNQLDVEVVRLSPRFPFDPFYLWRFRKKVKNTRPSLIHAMQALDVVYARLATLGLSLPVVYTLHGFHETTDSWVNRALFYWAFRGAKVLTFVSQFQRNWYVEKYGLDRAKTQVVYNGIDWEKFPMRSSFPESDKNKPWKLGSVGNFTSGRDHLFLCRVAAQLKAAEVPFQLELVGKPDPKAFELYQACVDFVWDHGLQEQVRFLGSRADVPKLLEGWDAFVYASVHDTFGIAVVEAMGAGLPVWVNDWEVMREITEEGKLAHLYSTAQVESLLSQLVNFVNGPSEYQEFAHKAAKQVRERYSIARHLIQLNELYSSL
jgi:L-malate glycosyltransferase